MNAPISFRSDENGPPSANTIAWTNQSHTNLDMDERRFMIVQQARLRLGYLQLFTLLAMSMLLLFTIPSEDRALRSTSTITEDMLLQTMSKATLSTSPKHTPTFLDTPHDKDDPEQPQPLEIVWLMSFPNSGTSYTTKLIRHVSLTSTASNYGNENIGLSGDSLPVYADQPTGPYWVDPLAHPVSL